MSYCRFGWEGSDVYVIRTAEGLVCYCQEHLICESEEAMIVHLAAHKRAGEFVPSSAIAELWDDIEGPAEPVRPEPESMTQARAEIAKLMAERETA